MTSAEAALLGMGWYVGGVVTYLVAHLIRSSVRQG